MKVYSAVHNDSPIISSAYIVPLRVGAAFGGCDQPGFLRDDEGDNISSRNREWCETTAHYWIWKNTHDDIVGLCHYRRYFGPYADKKFNRSMNLEETQDIISSDTSGSIFIDMLANVNFIVPIPLKVPYSLHLQYLESHRIEDWRALHAAMEVIYPQEAKEAFDFFQSDDNFYEYHMFIGRRAAVEAYYEWLFPLLFEAERRITPSTDPYQARVIGFLAERLFPWWLHSRNPSRACMPVMTVGSPSPRPLDFLRRTYVGRSLSGLRREMKVRKLDQQWRKHVWDTPS